MAQQLSPLKVRVSYAEHRHIREALESIAKEQGVTLTDIIQSATEQLISDYEEHSKAKRNAAKRTRGKT